MAACVITALVGCGGGSGSSGTSGATATSTVNHVPVVVDGGPPQVDAVNILYTTVTVCAPGSTTACQTIDHVQVDTGSTGFRVLASALANGLAPSRLRQATDANGNSIVECVQFADGYSWGPVKVADLAIAGETARNVAIQVIGDPAYPSSLIPGACVNIPNAEEDTLLQFGANAILGIGNFVQDCGPYCAQPGVQDGSAYNDCTSVAPVTCQPAAVEPSAQVSNPIASFASDNNGALIQLPSISGSGATTTSGTLTFGIGTQSNNKLGAATIYTLDPNDGTLLTTYAGVQLSQSYVDSGSNAYFFPDAGIPACPDTSYFYCPSSTLSRSGQLQGISGKVKNVSFVVSNADSLPATDAVDTGLAGPSGSTLPQSFTWGLPFFYGRNVFVVLEGATVSGVQGPAVAF